jgi:hypothetical protein
MEEAQLSESAYTSRSGVLPPDSEFASRVAKLDLAIKIRQSHHYSIWEEQKHFTWLISIILSAQAVVLAGVKLGSPQKAILISVASAVGILIALTAYRVQRVEGVYYCQSHTHFVNQYRAVYPSAEVPHYNPKPNKNIPELVHSILTAKSGVRDHFQFLFLSFMVVFMAIAIYSFIVL